MPDLKHRIEELEKSAAESDLLALLTYDPPRREQIQKLACDLKIATLNLMKIPSYRHD